MLLKMLCCPTGRDFQYNASGQHQPDLVRGASGRQNHFIFSNVSGAYRPERAFLYILILPCQGTGDFLIDHGFLLMLFDKISICKFVSQGKKK